jgi:hypothetical protein
MANEIFGIQVSGGCNRACEGSKWDWTVSAAVLRVQYQNVGLTCHPTSSSPFCKLSVDVRNIVIFRSDSCIRRAKAITSAEASWSTTPQRDGEDKRALEAPRDKFRIRLHPRRVKAYRTVPRQQPWEQNTVGANGQNPSTLLWLTPRSYPFTFRCYTFAKNSKWEARTYNTKR